MNLVPFGSHTLLDPIREFEALDKWFEDAFGERRLKGEMGTVWYPALDATETNQDYRYTVDLPGLEKDNIDISIQEGNLIVRGERKSEHTEKREGFNRVERWSGSYYRRIALPQDIDSEKIEANYHNGVLTVTIPKSESAKPHRIEIKS